MKNIEYRKEICENLKKQGVLNSRITKIIYSFKKDAGVNNFYQTLIKEKKIVKKMTDFALNKGAKIETDVSLIIKNLDNFDIKAYRKYIEGKLYFIKRKADCIKRLKNTSVHILIIESLEKATTIIEIDKTLEGLPAIFLIKIGLLKTKHGDGYLTKKSIRHISTSM